MIVINTIRINGLYYYSLFLFNAVMLKNIFFIEVVKYKEENLNNLLLNDYKVSTK